MMNYLTGWRRSGASSQAPAQDTQHGTAEATTSQTRSLELVRYNAESGKFEVGEEAIQVLKRTRQPVGVVAVAGRARQGKSYILNQLLGRSGGFQVAPTHRPCTKGLWMWSAPVSRTAADGSAYSLVLLDTEGIDAYDQTGQYSTQIFSLAVLLSSLFVYNQMGGIDEAALDRLSLVTEMTGRIRVRASDGAATDASELASFTPSFLWLLRDFYLRLEEDGRAVTPRDYLETALQMLPGTSEGVQSKNKIRESIKTLFPDRDCFTLVRPVNNEEDLGRLDTLSPSALRPEFKNGLAQLTSAIFRKAQPKRLGAQVITGPVLAGLTEAYVAAINAGAVPTIATAWQGVAEAECRRAADAAEAAYLASLPADLSPDEGSMEAVHGRAMEEGQRAFDAIAIGDEGVRLANDKRWRDAVTVRFRELKEKTLTSAALACERAINEGVSRLHTILLREDATVEDINNEASAFYEQYMNSNACGGPEKWKRLSQYMHDAYGRAQNEIAARQFRRVETQRAEVEFRAQQVQNRLAAAEKRVMELEAQLQELHGQRNRYESEITGLREQQTVIEADLRTKLQVEFQGRLQAELQGRIASWETEKARLQAAMQAATAARDEAASNLQTAQQGMEAAVAEGRRVSARVTELEQEVQGLRNQIAEQSQQLRYQSTPPTTGDAAGGDATISPGSGLRGDVSLPDTKKMTVAAMKSWLTDHGYEAMVWELNQKKAKKGDWEAAINSLVQ